MNELQRLHKWVYSLTTKYSTMRLSRFMVGCQATQKCDVKYIVKKMDFFFGTFLYDAQRLKKVMY